MTYKDTRECVVGYWRYRVAVVIGTLTVVILWQNFGEFVPRVRAESITYHSEACALVCIVESRAQELYKEREPVHMEMMRQEALQEIGGELYDMSKNSPYVDFDEIRAKLGQ